MEEERDAIITKSEFCCDSRRYPTCKSSFFGRETALGGSGPVIGGDPFMRPITVKGQVLLTNCSLDDVRKEQSGSNLSELTNERGNAVFRLTWANDRHLWQTIIWPTQLRVQTAHSLFQELISDENLRTDVQLTDFLRNTRTFDIG